LSGGRITLKCGTGAYSAAVDIITGGSGRYFSDVSFCDVKAKLSVNSFNVKAKLSVDSVDVKAKLSVDSVDDKNVVGSSVASPSDVGAAL
jgi:hypothetical protein